MKIAKQRPSAKFIPANRRMLRRFVGEHFGIRVIHGAPFDTTVTLLARNRFWNGGVK